MHTRTIDPADIVNLNIPNYSHGVDVDAATRWLHLSGQVGARPDGSFAPDFESQCRQALANIEACLRDADMNLNNVVMLRSYLTHREDLAALRRIRSEVFGDRHFASTLVFISGLVDPGWRVELEIVAAAA